MRKVTRALAELRPTDRELLQLSSWDGLARIEIAHVLGLKENAVDQSSIGLALA